MTLTSRLRLGCRIEDQWDLLENAMSLGGTTAVTATLGAVYWWLAARFLDPAAVGYGSAAIAAATLLGTVGMVGYGPLLIGRVVDVGASAGSLIATGLMTAGTVSLALGGSYGLLVPGVDEHFAPYCASVGGVLLFTATTCLAGTTTVLDDAMVGLFLGPVQLSRNFIFAVAKLLSLGILALAVRDPSSSVVLASWALGAAVSIIGVWVLLVRKGKSVRHAPRMIALRRSAKTAVMHHWINLATVAPRLLVPLLVTAVVSGTANGWLYPAWMVATLAYVLPQHLATSLFAVGSADTSSLAAKTSTSIKIATAVGVPATVLLAVWAHPIVGLFGRTYAEHATVPMRWLMVAYIPNMVRLHYVTVMRVQNRLATAATVMSGLGAVEVGAIVLGGALGGLDAVAAALAAVMWGEGVVTGVPVLRVMRGRPRSAGPARGHTLGPAGD